MAGCLYIFGSKYNCNFIFVKYVFIGFLPFYSTFNIVKINSLGLNSSIMTMGFCKDILQMNRLRGDKVCYNC